MMTYFIPILLIFPLFMEYEDITHDSQIQQMIEIVRQRLNIYSIECEYEVISDYYNDPELSKTMKVSYAMSGNNIWALYPVELFSIYNKRVKIDNDTPVTGLEDLIKRFTGIEEKVKINAYEGLYVYNGQIEIRHFRPKSTYRDGEFFVDYEGQDIVNWKHKVSILAYYGDLRLLIGYIGGYIEFGITAPYRKVIECLEKPGKYLFYEKDGYKILWHECTFKDSWFRKLGLPEEEYISFELWLDEDNNIVKIIEGYWGTRSLGEEKVKELCRKYGIETEINRDEPNYILRGYVFSNIKEFNEGVKVPLMGKITKYNLWNIKNKKSKYDNVFKKVDIDKNRNKIGSFELRTIYSIFMDKNDKRYENVITIHEETLKVNQAIPEERFIAPEPTVKEEESEDKKEDKWKNIYKSVLFVGIFMGVTLLGIFVTKRYLGWGF